MGAGDKRDWKHWDESAPSLPGWTRRPLEGQYVWTMIPDDVADKAEATLLVEWRPSFLGGWGPAAVWWPNEASVSTAEEHPAEADRVEPHCDFDCSHCHPDVEDEDDGEDG